jgi:type II secretory pathway component GspD/PulD (secretin)
MSSWVAPIAAVAAAVVLSVGALAASPQTVAQSWPDTPFQYNVVDQDLRDVFREYGRQLGVIVQLSDQVHGRVRSLSSDSTARDFLDRLANAHDLVWYFDGTILHVATTAEVVMQAMPAQGVALDQLNALLAERSSTDSRLGLRPGPKDDLIYVTGPASYITFVEQMAETLKATPVKESAPTSVHIYRNGKLSGS